MAAGRLLLPGWMPAVDSNGDPIPNAKVYFYFNKTSTLAPVYSDESLNVRIPNPVEANATGRFPAVWADGEVLYSASVEAPYGPAGVPFTYDNLSASLAAEIVLTEAAEAAANDAEVAYQNILDAIQAAQDADGDAALAGAIAGEAAAELVVGNKVDKSANLADVADKDAARENLRVALAITPEQFGAVGDGVVDDSEAMKAFIASPFAAKELTPGRVYLVNRTLGAGLPLLPCSAGFRLDGRGATIKVADGCPGYYAILGSENPNTDLSGLDIYNVIFDHNVMNGPPLAVVANVLTEPRFTVSARKGRGLRFAGNVVTNASQTNSVYFNGAETTSDIIVSDNQWLSVGANPSNVVHDYSTYYLVGDNIVAERNHVEGAYWGAPGAICPGEVHPGDTFRVCNNTWDKMKDGLNIAGIYRGGDTKNGLVSGNVGTSGARGIRLFSIISGPHNTGWGLDNVLVEGNVLTILNAQHGEGVIGCPGIVLEASTLPTRGVRILSNTVTFEAEDSPPLYSGVSPGIGFREQSGTILHQDVEIGFNTVINAPGPGVSLGMGGGVFQNATVKPNVIINPGQGRNSASAGVRYGVYCFPNQFTHRLVIERQIITDDFPVTRIFGGVYTSAVSANVAMPASIEASITIVGDASSFTQPLTNTSSRIIPLANVDVNRSWSVSPSHTYKAGSVVRDTANSIIRRVRVEGGVWSREDYGVSPPVTGLWSLGDVRWNNDPALDTALGWVCTVPGTPGTWSAFAPVGTVRGAAQPNSVATDVSGVVDDLNSLLAKLRSARIIAT